MTPPITILAAAGAALLSSLAPALAAAQPEAQAVRQLSECRKLGADAARLACYDAAAQALEAATARGDIVVVERDQVREVRRQAFGFALPSLSLFDGGKDETMADITLKVVSASRGGDGKWLLRLEGGQVWRQIDTTELARYPKPGGTVTISRAALGSYKLSTGGAAAIRVRREA